MLGREKAKLSATEDRGGNCRGVGLLVGRWLGREGGRTIIMVDQQGREGRGSPLPREGTNGKNPCLEKGGAAGGQYRDGERRRENGGERRCKSICQRGRRRKQVWEKRIIAPSHLSSREGGGGVTFNCRSPPPFFRRLIAGREATRPRGADSQARHQRCQGRR